MDFFISNEISGRIIYKIDPYIALSLQYGEAMLTGATCFSFRSDRDSICEIKINPLFIIKEVLVFNLKAEDVKFVDSLEKYPILEEQKKWPVAKNKEKKYLTEYYVINSFRLHVATKEKTIDILFGNADAKEKNIIKLFDYFYAIVSNGLIISLRIDNIPNNIWNNFIENVVVS